MGKKLVDDISYWVIRKYLETKGERPTYQNLGDGTMVVLKRKEKYIKSVI